MPHIHYFFGNDEYTIRQQVKQFNKLFTDPTTADLNTSHLDARGVSETDLSNAVGAMPFLAAQRLVILEHISKRYNGQEGHKKFTAFLETVPPFTQLVIIDPEDIKEKDIQNHWMMKWAAKHAEIAEARAFLLPKQREMPTWIIAETKRQGGSIEPGAAARLAEMTGENTRQAAQEITKLLTYVNYAHPIGLEDVEAVSLVTAGVDIFDLVDALGTRDGRKAQRLLHRLLEEKDAFELFGMVIRQFRLLTITCEVMDESGTLEEAAAALGTHPFVAEKAWQQARKFNAETLHTIYHRLLAMDEAAKTGVMPLDLALDTFVVEITR
ncbi:MAG: DNA polymerase III subunit delta [Anaerolineae bacterium]|nr:MAG: DNA polymerase III subunit delta [Anaerolineae bacterium]